MHCLSVDKPGAIAILNGCFYETRPKPTFVDMNVLTVVADEFKERAEAMADRIKLWNPTIDLYKIKSSGHWPSIEVPDIISNAILARLPLYR